MAIHAGLRWGDSSVTRLLHRRMTVLALNTQPLHVMLVAEGHRLVRALTLPRHPGRALQLIQGDPQSDHDQPRQNQAHASQGIGAAIKYLRHECVPCSIFFSWRSE